MNAAGAPAVQSGYNRNLGLEYNLASKDNLWTGKALYLRSFTSGNQGGGNVYAGHLQYFSRRWLISGQTENVDPNYIAEAGYVPRNGYHRALGTIGYTFLPEGGRVLSHGPTLTTSNFFDWTGKLSDYETALGYTVTLRSGDVFSTSGGADYVRLLQPFDPTNSGREKLAGRQRAPLEVLEYQVRLQAAECVAVWLLVPGRGLLCRRHTAKRVRHDRLPVSAVRQPGRHCDVQ